MVPIISKQQLNTAVSQAHCPVGLILLTCGFNPNPTDLWVSLCCGPHCLLATSCVTEKAILKVVMFHILVMCKEILLEDFVRNVYVYVLG